VVHLLDVQEGKEAKVYVQLTPEYQTQATLGTCMCVHMCVSGWSVFIYLMSDSM
jgi:hypothetical protein